MIGLQTWTACVSNRFLATLSPEDFERLRRWIRRVDLSERQTLHWAGEPLGRIYFPTTAVLSLTNTLSNGGTMELGLIGNEGMSGISVLLGYPVAQFDTVVRIPGIAYELPAVVITNELHDVQIDKWEYLRYTHHYAIALLTQVAKRVSCTAHHTIQQRMATYLLLLRDRIGPGELRLTHEVLAQALGSGRPSVTLSFDSLQHAGIVQSGRGKILVRDWTALEQRACECYHSIHDDYQRILD